MDDFNIGRLNCDTVTSKPVDIDWREAMGEDMEGWQFWEAFEYEVDDETTVQLIANSGSVLALVWEGNTYERHEYDDYAEWTEDLPEAERFTREDFDDLFDVEPYMHGAEGPMMNYWYPLTTSNYEHERFDPKWAARKLGVNSLCVVEVGTQYGLALAGGGMDFSWQIVEAFVLLGYMPPVHFRLPAMAFHTTTDSHRRALHGMAESYRWLKTSIEHDEKRMRELATEMGVTLP